MRDDFDKIGFIENFDYILTYKPEQKITSKQPKPILV